MRKVRHILEDPSPCAQCDKECHKVACQSWIDWFRQRWPIACDLVRAKIKK